MATEDSEVRALVLARTSQGRMVRAAYGLYESALQAADLCQKRVMRNPQAADVSEWEERAKHWQLTAHRALEVVADWEDGPLTR